MLMASFGVFWGSFGGPLGDFLGSLDAVLAAEAALDATRREVALADSEPDPDALAMREKWQSQEWRRDDAKAEQRLRKIKELMKTDHVRRFAPLLTGQQEAPAPG